MKLVLFAACDKVLVDQDRNLSLILIHHTVHLVIPSGQVVPPNAMLPKEWYVTATWHANADEVGRNFTQIIEFDSPTGSAILPRVAVGPFSFTVTGERRHVNTISLHAFPGGQQGMFAIRTWLEEHGSRATDISTYEVKIVHRQSKSDDFFRKL